MPKLTLISFALCPYVQRAVITLEDKAVPYQVRLIDLANKPDWFLAISPFGKVPVLLVDDTPVFESAVIAEYLDEVYAPRLHPEDPLERARHRSWIELVSALLIDNWKLGAATTRDEATPHATALRDKLARLEDQLGDGPFFAGERFSLMDATAAPLFQRLAWAQELAPDLALLAELPKVRRWADALLAHPSVRRSTVSGGLETFTTGLQRYNSWLLPSA